MVLDSAKKWANQPYNPNMNLMGWFLMLGIFIVGSMLWAMILGHIKAAVEE